MKHHHLPALDGIRGIAVLVVICGHNWLFIRGGNFGVDAFFVLSGFLITTLLLREAREFGSINIPYFYARRALRLLPVLYVTVALIVLYYVVFYPHYLALVALDAGWIVAYAYNWTLPQAGLHSGMLMHLWSLSVEEQFYLVWPLLLVLMIRSGKARILIPTFLALGIILPEAIRASMWNRQPVLWMYFNTALRCDGLMMGAGLAYVAHLFPRISNSRLAGVLRLSGPVALAGLLSLCYFDLFTNGYIYLWAMSAANFFTMVTIASAALSPSRALNMILEFRPLRWVGKISYGLYVLHIPLPVFLSRYIDNPLARAAILFAVAALSFYYLESPFLEMKRRFTPLLSARRYTVAPNEAAVQASNSSL